MFRDPILETGCFYPLRGDGESAFAQPKDIPSVGSRQDIWLLPSLLAGILRGQRKILHEVRRRSDDSWRFAPVLSEVISRCQFCESDFGAGRFAS